MTSRSRPRKEKKVLLDQVYVEVHVPPRLSTKKARMIRAVVEKTLRDVVPTIERAVRTSAGTRPGEVVICIGDGA